MQIVHRGLALTQLCLPPPAVSGRSTQLRPAIAVGGVLDYLLICSCRRTLPSRHSTQPDSRTSLKVVVVHWRRTSRVLDVSRAGFVDDQGRLEASQLRGSTTPVRLSLLTSCELSADQPTSSRVSLAPRCLTSICGGVVDLVTQPVPISSGSATRNAVTQFLVIRLLLLSLGSSRIIYWGH